jgi:hypothetical protein
MVQPQKKRFDWGIASRCGMNRIPSINIIPPQRSQ